MGGRLLWSRPLRRHMGCRLLWPWHMLGSRPLRRHMGCRLLWPWHMLGGRPLRRHMGCRLLWPWRMLGRPLGCRLRLNRRRPSWRWQQGLPFLSPISRRRRLKASSLLGASRRLGARRRLEARRRLDARLPIWRRCLDWRRCHDWRWRGRATPTPWRVSVRRLSRMLNSQPLLRQQNLPLRQLVARVDETLVICHAQRHARQPISHIVLWVQPIQPAAVFRILQNLPHSLGGLSGLRAPQNVKTNALIQQNDIRRPARQMELWRNPQRHLAEPLLALETGMAHAVAQ